MSGLIKRSIVIDSGTLNRNIIEGENFETLTRPGQVRVIVNQEIVNASDIEITWTIGNVIGTQDMRPNVAENAGRIDRAEDGLPPAVGGVGDRIVISAREVTGAANADGILNYSVEVTDIM